MNLDQVELMIVDVVALSIRLAAWEGTDVELTVHAPALDLRAVGFGVADL